MYIKRSSRSKVSRALTNTETQTRENYKIEAINYILTNLTFVLCVGGQFCFNIRQCDLLELHKYLNLC